ncbi:hypothetical protein FACS1894185_1850 [Betaproteobacteria bacterium]|nr:hypothetical protein FACS1894185_1850 [Betaproteobacteria bacterium]
MTPVSYGSSAQPSGSVTVLLKSNGQASFEAGAGLEIRSSARASAAQNTSGITAANGATLTLNFNGAFAKNVDGTDNLDASGGTLNFYVPNSTIHVGIEGASSLLTAGDHLVLIGATATRSTLMATQGISLLYTFDLSVDGVTNQLIASLPSALPPPMTPPPVPRL